MQHTVRDVQSRILEIMKFIDQVCRSNDIIYYIMGGTALGAVRHGGFIPWDDDLDIFMTQDNYMKFKSTFSGTHSEKYVLQEWKIVDEYIEYSKIRMNGTTFLEEAFKDCHEMHHGVYVDIMILHKCPDDNRPIQRLLYYASKYVTLVALSQRNWKPKNLLQKSVLRIIKLLPYESMSKQCYKLIYKYDRLTNKFNYFYFITKATFKQGIFERSMFERPSDIQFEDTVLMGPTNIKQYLEYRYGNYMELPSANEIKYAVHAQYVDLHRDYQEVIKDRCV